MKELFTRTISGAVFVAILVASILVNQYTFVILFYIISVLAIWEFFELSNSKMTPGVKYLTIFLHSILYCAFAFLQFKPIHVIIGVAGLFIYALVLSIMHFKRGYLLSKRQVQKSWLSILYITIPFSVTRFFVIDINGESFYPYLFLGLLVNLWSYDTFAYLSGKMLGKHQMAKKISPGKTWEGFAGGSILTILCAVVLSNYITAIHLWDWIIASVIIVIFGTMGDLVESKLKRAAKVKDSSHIIPGHGGILDRFDGFLIAFPLLLLYFAIRGII